MQLRASRKDLAERIERFTAVPMMALALVYLVVFALGYLPGVPEETRQAAEFGEYIIIAAFAAELLVKLAVAERKSAFLQSHWLDVVIVLVPFLRPLRFLRVMRALPFVGRLFVGLRTYLGPYHGAYVLMCALASIIVSAGLMTLFEAGGEGTIQTIEDALWWAVATVTTVGYGDVAPVTPEGRAVAVFLMVVGIALFSMLTASLAAYFVGENQAPEAAKDQVQRLSKAKAMLDQNLISDAEYQEVKARILSSL